MEYSQLMSKIKDLEQEYTSKINKLKIEYAKAHNPYSVGDIVEDHLGKLLIEKIKFTERRVVDKTIPYCFYIGKELNKNGSVSKKQTGRKVYQFNILEHESNE